ncbi:hypothetical protein WJX73_006293 [Symbiochloris irregularis]|uniref:Uncharacterized protein n=1 Tax=Symbiochloris irregularis TaxID=706552 RepID=A0AAW1NXM3_9CHLO
MGTRSQAAEVVGDPMRKKRRVGDDAAVLAAEDAAAQVNEAADQAAEEAEYLAQMSLGLLEDFCANPRTRLNPPAMDVILEDDYAERVIHLAQDAINAGHDKGAIYQVLESMYECTDDVIPPQLKKQLMPAQNPDDLLHRLMEQDYPPDAKLPVEEEDRVGDSLPELLERATPNIQDDMGNTVLHVLLERALGGQYFPDDSIAAFAASYGRGYSPYHWRERQQYLQAACRLLVDAGWSLDLPNEMGRTPEQMLQAGQRGVGQLAVACSAILRYAGRYTCSVTWESLLQVWEGGPLVT